MTFIAKDAVWRKIRKEVNKANQGAHARVGVLQGKGAEEQLESGISMVELAVIQHFGSDAANIPARDFILSTFVLKKRELALFQGKLLKQVMAQKITFEKALELLGLWGATEVKKRILEGDGIGPPNAPSTIAKKGSDRPLVDTGRLVQAIQHAVHKREGSE